MSIDEIIIGSGVILLVIMIILFLKRAAEVLID